MKTGGMLAGLVDAIWRRGGPAQVGEAAAPREPVRIGLALGGGFARGIAHIGVLRALERNGIPIHCVVGVSAGAMVAAAYASGTTPDEIAGMARTMRFGDVARWTIPRLGFAGSDRMVGFLRRLLKCYRFEEMQRPLGVVATDLLSGEAVLFRDRGDVFVPIRASCSYPGLFQPVRYLDHLLVDGAMSMEVPCALARAMGATKVIAVHLPSQRASVPPQSVFAVVNRCFQIMQKRTEESWRTLADAVVVPDVRGMEWDAFNSAEHMMQAGDMAASESLPTFRAWLEPVAASPSPGKPPKRAAIGPGATQQATT